MPGFERLKLRSLFAAALLMTAPACKGGGNATLPTTPTPPPVVNTTTPLPYGQATSASAACPSGSAAGSACARLVVSCPSAPTAGAILRVTRPASSVANRGTVVLTTGGDGTAFSTNISSLAPAMIAIFVAEGLTVVEIAWEAPGIWGGPRARTLACRYATAAKWTNENVHIGGRSALFAAQGTSGGASQIAFGLAHYGVSDFLDLANLGGGPPGCPLCSPDGQNAPEPLLPGSPPALNREPLLAYPSTVVRFFLGDQEPGADIIADANAYYGALTSAKSFRFVPGTAHNIEQTQAGVEAFVAAVRAAMK